MVGDHPVSGEFGLTFGVGLSGERLGLLDDGPEEVGVIVGFHALEECREPLETHAGVHVLGGERLQSIVAPVVVLDEHEVPDFGEAGAVAVDAADVSGHAAFVAGLGATVIVDFGAGAAGTGVPHFPEVVFASEGENVLGRDVGLGAPARGGFLVGAQLALIVLEDGRPQAVFLQAVDAGEQVPGPADGFLFVVIAEGPVAQHLKESVMGAIAPHIVEIIVFAGDAHTFLRISGAGVRARPRAQEDVLELVHTGVGEQEGGIILRHETGAGHNRVAPLGKIIQESLANLGAGQFLGHGSFPPRLRAVETAFSRRECDCN